MTRDEQIAQLVERYRVKLNLLPWAQHAERVHAMHGVTTRRTGRTARGILEAFAKCERHGIKRLYIAEITHGYCLNMARDFLGILMLDITVAKTHRADPMRGDRACVVYIDHAQADEPSTSEVRGHMAVREDLQSQRLMLARDDDDFHRRLRADIENAQADIVRYLATPIRVTADPTMPPDRFEIRGRHTIVGVDMASGPDRAVFATRCALCSTELPDDATTEQHRKVCGPDALKVGDHVRWEWPDRGVWAEGSLVHISTISNWPPDAATIMVEAESGGFDSCGGDRPCCGRVHEFGFGGLDDGITIRRIPRPGPFANVDRAAPVQSLRVDPIAPQLIDGLTRERCLELYELKQREGRDPDDSWGCARIELTPNQLAVAREMWSATLRVKVAARKEAERCAVGYCEVDVDD